MLGATTYPFFPSTPRGAAPLREQWVPQRARAKESERARALGQKPCALIVWGVLESPASGIFILPSISASLFLDADCCCFDVS